MRLPVSLVQLVSLIVFVSAFAARAQAENWPQWRGPHNNGISDEKNLPATWSKTENVVWRLPMPGPAGSTPVVWDDKIFLTSAKGADLVLMCVSTKGEILWERKVGTGDAAVRGDEGNMASPSPSTDGKMVWTLMGQGDLACYTVDGKQVWHIDVNQRFGKLDIAFGLTSTPVLDGDRLYLQLFHTGGATVAALDKTTGRNIWVHNRISDATNECLHSYASPVMYRDSKQEFLLCHGCDYITAHSLKDGHELWRCGGLNGAGGGKYNPTLRFVASPAAVPGMIIVPSAKNGPVLALTPDGKGNITQATSEHLWTRPQNTPDVPSPLIVGDYVYLCRENGVLICLDAKTGEEKYQERAFSDRYRASPVYADGKIYLVSRKGVTTVVKPGPTFEVLSSNDLEEAVSSGMCVAGGRIYLRSFDALYAIANSKGSAAATRPAETQLADLNSPFRSVAIASATEKIAPFNGRDFSGWQVEGKSEYTVDGKSAPVWSVVDGRIVCAGSGYGFLRYEQPLTDFVFRCEVQLAPKCNSGVGIRGTRFTGPKETRPSFFGYEIQLLDDSGKKPDDHSSGSLYRYVAATGNPFKPAGQWNLFEVECRGPRIRLTVNGETIQDVDQSQIAAIRDKPTSGYLSLQNHGGHVEFRNLELTLLGTN